MTSALLAFRGWAVGGVGEVGEAEDDGVVWREAGAVESEAEFALWMSESGLRYTV